LNTRLILPRPSHLSVNSYKCKRNRTDLPLNIDFEKDA